jgi:hypothetical protein
MMIALGLVFGALGALRVGVVVVVLGAVGCVLISALTYTGTGSRSQRAFSSARSGLGVSVEAVRGTMLRALWQTLLLAALFLLLTLVPLATEAAIAAGIALSNGVVMLTLAFQFNRWETDDNTRLVRLTPDGYGPQFRWGAQELDPRQIPTDHCRVDLAISRE